MDFNFSEEEQAIVDITTQILRDKSTHERLRQLLADDVHLDGEAWSALAEAGVLGASLPEAYGGAGLGFMATAAAAEVVGSTAASIPFLSSVVMGALPIAEFGTDDQKAAHLPGLADGSTVATAAFNEDITTAVESQVVATPDGDGFRIDGAKSQVLGGLDATLALVSVRYSTGGVGVLLVPTDTEGLERQRVDVTTKHPDARYEFNGVTVGADAVLGGPSADGDDIVAWITLRANTAMCMMMSGAAQASIDLAAEYTKVRQQFDRPIATFQAVSQRAGETYIDTEAIRLTAYQAAWRIDQGMPAADAVSIAKYWAGEGGFRVVHGALHVHGGVGVDRDYPLHRHFLLARYIELFLGNAEEQLQELGHSIATAP